MSSLSRFTFTEVKLQVVAINDKPWITKKVCKPLEYNKKTAHVKVTVVQKAMARSMDC